ncbi:MAG: gamma-glutamyltransferase [Pseudomonadota bacterium]
MSHRTTATMGRFLACLFSINLLLSACTTGSQYSGAVNATAATQSSGAVLRYDSVHHPVIARRGMVVSQNELATKVGQQILADGGNAVDAAVGVGFALAVTLPRAGNLGGSGFMLLHINGADEPTALDFRSAAPAAAMLADYQNEQGDIDWNALTYGPRAAGVPGTVAGLYHAWEKFGSMPWPVLLEPARLLAAEGIEVTQDLEYALKEALPVMEAFPASMAAYAKSNKTAYVAGEMLVQADLAQSIAAIAAEGSAAFYEGEIAHKISDYMQNTGGNVSLADLKNYRVKERTVLQTRYRNHRIATMPPSSVGGLALLQMLSVLQNFDLSQYPAGSAMSLHIIAETMKQVAANRRFGIGDPDFVDVPVNGFLSEEMADVLAGRIDLSKARATKKIDPENAQKYESRETTHYSVVDAEGNAVSTTYTLGYSFGSAAVVPGTGILLDNQLRNFSHRTPEHANGMRAGKRMLSTMTPTLVFDENGELLLVTGTPGGSRIHNVVLQILINTIDYGMNIAEASHRPRIHQQWRTPALGVEPGIGSDTLKILQGMGHIIDLQQTMGSTQSIMRRDGYLFGAADPRRPGALALGND